MPSTSASASGPDSSGKWLDDQRLLRAFARIEPRAFGISCGVVASILLFAATAYLAQLGSVGVSDIPGEGLTGPHLALLSHVMPGYSVTWTGAAVGLVWGFVDGFVVGYLLAGAFNLHHRVYLRLIERRRRRRELLNG